MIPEKKIGRKELKWSKTNTKLTTCRTLAYQRLMLSPTSVHTLHLAFFSPALYVLVIGQAWGQDGWILAKFFFFLRFYGPRLFCRPRRSLELAKKKTRPTSSNLDQANLVNKGFIVWLRGNVSCGTRRVVPSGQDSSTMEGREDSGTGLFLLLQYFVSAQF